MLLLKSIQLLNCENLSDGECVLACIRPFVLATKRNKKNPHGGIKLENLHRRVI
jgi:hypothetical protein